MDGNRIPAAAQASNSGHPPSDGGGQDRSGGSGDGDGTTVITLQARGQPAPLALLLIATTLTVMSAAVLSPVLELIRRDLGLDATGAGVLFTVHAAAVALTSPLWGRLVDRWGVRRPLAAGLLIYGIGGGSGLFLDSFAALLAGRLLFGVGAAAVFTAATVALLTYYRGPEQDRVMGWRIAATSAGGVIWPLLAGVVGALSWHAPFALYLVGIPLAVAALRLLPRTGEQRWSARHTGGATRSGRGGVLTLLRQPTMVRWLSLHAVNGMLLYVAVVFMPIRLAEAGVEQPFWVAVIGVTVSAAGSVTGLRYASVKRRLGYRALLGLAVMCWLVTFVLLGLAAHVALIVPALVLYGVGLGLAMPALTSLINDSAPAHQRGQATALSGTVLFAGQFLTPLLVGPAMDAFSLDTGYWLAAAVAALVAPLVLRAPLPDGTGQPVLARD